jgi:hypothetical protein
MLDIIIERTVPPDEVIRRAVCYFIVLALQESIDSPFDIKVIYLFINDLHNILATFERQGYSAFR